MFCHTIAYQASSYVVSIGIKWKDAFSAFFELNFGVRPISITILYIQFPRFYFFNVLFNILICTFTEWACAYPRIVEFTASCHILSR